MHLKINVVERGTAIACEGPAAEVLALIELLGVTGAALCIRGGRAAACWAA